MSDAIIIIDLQRDFLEAERMFKRPVPGDALVESLGAVLPEARRRGMAIFWVSSHYPERVEAPPPVRPPRPEEAWAKGVPQNDDYLASGHAGRPCCRPDSEGAELWPPAAELVAPEDRQIVKDRYSAFTETTLHDALRAAGVKRVFITGVVANVCVQATAADAFFLGYEVVAIADCIGATTPNRHHRGLTAIGTHYGQLISSAELLGQWGADRSGIGAGDSAVMYGVLSSDLAETAFDDLMAEIDWQDMVHRGSPVPRRMAIQATVEHDRTPLYRHPADEQPVLTPWTPTVEKLKIAAERRLGQRLNHALIQLYPDGYSHIGVHADKTLDIERGSAVVNLSLGATRMMVLKDKASGATRQVEMPHNSLFVLGWRTNRLFQHGIKPDKRTEGERPASALIQGGARISLTFRTVSTFIEADGSISGQGAPKPGFEGRPWAVQRDQLSRAFGLENRTPDFDWDAEYGQGFDILDMGRPRE
ncbi:MAG: isochorismatase family protein [Bradymonadia bacterium]